ncbi:terpenoid synthase [Sanghuangporus baumii]|uniref:Terpene synthase n=1 Tax=Sanghuangporus baumii TaxID=108892 RepID=A0A9Q5HT32_SANBA|nr:terpenoid synthase [Sanghuangporus baumii]
MSNEIPSFHLPDTMADWNWPRTINPYYEEVQKESNTWFLSFKAFSTKSQYAFDKCNFALLAALVYPNASKEHLRTGCDLMSFLFAIDEYTDMEPEHVVRELTNIVIDATRNPQKPRPTGEVALGEVARQFWALATKAASPSSQRHMLEALIPYLNSLVEQARGRVTGPYPSISVYLGSRRLNVGTQPSFVPLGLGMDMIDEVFYHPVMVELTGYITDLVILDNDLVSYNKEQAIGDDHDNILTVVMNEYNVDVQGAIQWAVSYHSEVKMKFLDGLDRVPSWDPDMDRQVRQYLHGLANWARGNHCWSFEGGRYFGDKGLGYQKSRVIPLLPKDIPFRNDTSCRRENVVVPLIEALEAKI